MRTPVALPPSSNGKERAVLKRRRFIQANTLEDRCAKEAQRLRQFAKLLQPGPEREAAIRKARQMDIVAHISDWLRSPGLQPPK